MTASIDETSGGIFNQTHTKWNKRERERERETYATSIKTIQFDPPPTFSLAPLFVSKQSSNSPLVCYRRHFHINQKKWKTTAAATK